MVVLCFVLALVLLAAALYLLWLDRRQKQRRSASSRGGAQPRQQPRQLQQHNVQGQGAYPQQADFQQPQAPAPTPQTAVDDTPRPPIRPAAAPSHPVEPQAPEQPFAQPSEPARFDDGGIHGADAVATEEPKSDQPKRGRLGKLLSGIGQGSKSRGAGVAAGAAAGAGAVGLGAAAMTRDGDDDGQAGEPGDSDVMGENRGDAPEMANYGQTSGPQEPEEGSLAAIQQQWLDARSFTEVAREDSPIAGEPVDGLAATQRVFTGTFRGCESVITFAGPRTFVSLSRPGPATTAFIMERTASADEGNEDATVEQMNLRSDDPAADALLQDPRVVTALRGAPGEFQYCDVTEKWGHTSLPEDAISHYDGSIVTLHALVSAAAALPAYGGAPLDLSSTDPGNAAVGRSEGADTEITPPRVVDAEEFDADIEDLGDDLESAPLDETAVPFEPRKPGRAGHLRLVKSAGEDGNDRSVAASDPRDSGPSSGAASAGLAAGAAAGAAGVAGGAAVVDKGDSDASSEKEESALGGHEADSDVMGDADMDGADQDESEIVKDATTEIEPDPFEAAMRSDSVPADRGDVAADFLPQRDPVPRPNRATSARYGDGEGMPALAEPSIGAHGGADDEFKPLGSSGEEPEESRESISEEVRRFETARTEGPVEATDEAPVAPVTSSEPAASPAPTVQAAPRPAASGGGRHRRADDNEDEQGENPGSAEPKNQAAEGAGGSSSAPHIGGNALDPDFVETTRFRAPNLGGGSHRGNRDGGES